MPVSYRMAEWIKARSMGYVYAPWIPFYSTCGDSMSSNQREKYDAFMEAYDTAHDHCPKCNSTDYWTTLVGYIVNWEHPETYRDGNRGECNNCGWVGIKHDLV